MDEFCGDVRNAWGVSARGYLTHCFDDLVVFGATYAFVFVAGSYRAWTLLHIPPAAEFPYSTLHSVKVPSPWPFPASPWPDAMSSAAPDLAPPSRTCAPGCAHDACSARHMSCSDLATLSLIRAPRAPHLVSLSPVACRPAPRVPQVLVLGWLGILPIGVFAVKYANGTHDDFEWVAKPLSSLAWLFSLWLLNMEVARDLRECWVLKVFWVASAVAGTIALPTVILAAETNGYGLPFYVYMVHYVLYLIMAALVVRFPHKSSHEVPELVGFGGVDDGAVAGKNHQGFLTQVPLDPKPSTLNPKP